jgi:hypothetical protein
LCVVVDTLIAQATETFAASLPTARPPLWCATKLYLEQHRGVAAGIIVALVMQHLYLHTKCCLQQKNNNQLVLLIVTWRRHQQRVQETRIKDVANQVFTMLKAQKLAYRNGQSAEEYIALVKLI